MTESVQRAARSTALRRLAQLGFAGYGLLHLLVAWLALELAWGPGGRTADQAGALAVLHRSPGGGVLLWVLAVGLAGLGVWQAVEVVRHHRHLPPRGPKRRAALVQAAKTVGSALLYGFLAVSAARAALGDGQRRGDEEQAVRGVLGWPGGQVLVIGVGLVVVAIGGYLIRKGLRSDFLDEIDLASVAPGLCALTHRFSQVGFVLKGVAAVLVGLVVAWAALTFDPARATGLDGALRAVAAEPYGQWVLTVVAAGLAAFTVYCLARARHPVG
ncbi:DUF1206 domain-containing protein [Geodermatophilus sp. URMC 64]